MSGGSHNYIGYRIEEQLVGQMEDAELDDLMKDIVTLAHDLEWMDSGDIGEDNYRETVKWFKEKWFANSREDRLKGYVDEKIEALRRELNLLWGMD